MKLYYNPLSSYSQKTLIAFHEKGVAYVPEVVPLMDPAARAAYEKIYPLGKVPLLVLDDGWMIPESTIIIEYLDTNYGEGTRLIPEERGAARQTRFWDRMGDLYVNEPVAKILFDGMKPVEKRDADGVARAKKTLDIAYAGVEQHLATRGPWLMGEGFTMADCAWAPALGYARMAYPFEAYPHLSEYFARISERPSFVKMMEEATPAMAAFLAR